MVEAGPTEKVAFEEVPEAGEGTNLEGICGKNAPARITSECKGPGAGPFLLCLRSGEEAGAPGG